MTGPLPPLYHYTCRHTVDRVGREGLLRPALTLTDAVDTEWWPASFVWLTDLGFPFREALGLTNSLGGCDRTEYRYRVTLLDTCHRWTEVRRTVDTPEILENAPGARPAHWWVSTAPVPVRLDARKRALS